MEKGPHHEAPVYPTMWRPKLLKGVPREWGVVSIFIALAANVAAFNIFVGFGVFAVLWIYGFLRAKDDPEFFAVWVIKVMRIGRTGGADGNEYRA